MPFVQGHLRSQPVEIAFRTECAHCARPIRFEVDSDLRYRVDEGGSPLIFMPLVDFQKLEAPNIIDPF